MPMCMLGGGPAGIMLMGGIMPIPGGMGGMGIVGMGGIPGTWSHSGGYQVILGLERKCSY